MKTLVCINIDSDSKFAFDSIFNEESAFQRVLNWINFLHKENKCGEISKVIFIATGTNKTLLEEKLSSFNLKYEICYDDFSFSDKLLTVLKDKVIGFENVIYGNGNCPFYDPELTANLYELHINSAAEYTFADGWPEGLAPVIINSGTIAILASLTSQNPIKVERDVFFDIMKTEINSFEIETLLAPEDTRQYRFDFSCDSKIKTLACKNLFDSINTKANPDFSANAISLKAIFSNNILRTLPAFYNVQISSVCAGTCSYCPYPISYKEKYGHNCSEAIEKNSNCFMPLEKFEKIVEQMHNFSEEAVVSLSLWGEPLLHPNFIKMIETVLKFSGLSVLIETDACNISSEMIEEIKKIEKNAETRKKNKPAIIWIVSLDSNDSKMYSTMRGCGTDKIPVSFEKASLGIDLLQKSFPDTTYVQFVRTVKNEEQLESFYRTRKDMGEIIIQKYDSFAGFLPNLQVADLSPLVRNPCWHQRRDMTILADGTVLPCREFLLNEKDSIGNVFEESLESLWFKDKDMIYKEKCRNCDEYYTFNF